MPNWVYNTLKITGDKSDVEAFAESAKQPSLFTIEGKYLTEFSFANFIHPPQYALESGEYWATNGWQGGQEVGNTANNWYNWNNKYWGTKWDACNVDVDIAGTVATYSFETAWAPPVPVFYAMVEQFTRLSFELYYKEEQGWGGELHGDNGIHWVVKEWDSEELENA